MPKVNILILDLGPAHVSSGIFRSTKVFDISNWIKNYDNK